MGVEDILTRVAVESPWALVAFYVLTRVNATLEKLTRAVEDLDKNFHERFETYDKNLHARFEDMGKQFGTRLDKIESELHSRREHRHERH